VETKIAAKAKLREIVWAVEAAHAVAEHGYTKVQRNVVRSTATRRSASRDV